mgnify:CR=1 FL=1
MNAISIFGDCGIFDTLTQLLSQFFIGLLKDFLMPNVATDGAFCVLNWDNWVLFTPYQTRNKVELGKLNRSTRHCIRIFGDCGI